jgi:hypothetical protein
MDGIGGLVIGHIFRIPDDVLPKGYKGGAFGSKLGYIITGIGHKISNNDWTTNIDAQTIILDDPTEGIDVDYKSLVQAVAESFVKGSTAVPADLTNPPITTSSGNVTIRRGESIKKVYEPALAKITSTQGLKILSEGHSVIEGFFPGSRGYRNNNPGNLAHSPLLAKNFGAVLEPANSKGERVFSKFPTLELGIKAKINYAERIIAGQHKQYPTDPSLSVYIYQYAPPKDPKTGKIINDTEGYIKKMIKWFADNGITINRNTKLSQIRDIK